MSEIVKIRKVQKVETLYASKPIEVDVEKLRKCEPPYIGNSEKELLEYLSENTDLCDDFYDNDTNTEVLGGDLAYDLAFEDGILFSDNIISTSQDDNSWFESVEVNSDDVVMVVKETTWNERLNY